MPSYFFLLTLSITQSFVAYFIPPIILVWRLWEVYEFISLKEDASLYSSIFAQFMTILEKQMLARESEKKIIFHNRRFTNNVVV